MKSRVVIISTIAILLAIVVLSVILAFLGVNLDRRGAVSQRDDPLGGRVGIEGRPKTVQGELKSTIDLSGTINPTEDLRIIDEAMLTRLASGSTPTDEFGMYGIYHAKYGNDPVALRNGLLSWEQSVLLAKGGTYDFVAKCLAANDDGVAEKAFSLTLMYCSSEYSGKLLEEIRRRKATADDSDLNKRLMGYALEMGIPQVELRSAAMTDKQDWYVPSPIVRSTTSIFIR